MARLRDWRYAGNIYHGKCPACGVRSTEAQIELAWGFPSAGDAQKLLDQGKTLHCYSCKQDVASEGKRTYWRPGKGRLRDYYKRDAQLMVSNPKVEKPVKYGMLNKLQEESGRTLPKMWRGDVDKLAADLSMTPERVAQVWRVPIEELRSYGTMEVSL